MVMVPLLDQVLRFADTMAPLMKARRIGAWRVLARGYLVAPGLGPGERGEGAVVGVSCGHRRSGVLSTARLDTEAVDSWITSGVERRGPPWQSVFDTEVLLAASAGRATLPASAELLALIDDKTRTAKLFALERATRAALERSTSDPVEVTAALVVERRIEMGSTRDRSDELTASIHLDFAVRRDAAPHRLYGEELTAADLYDWTLSTRELPWFPEPEALERVVTDVLSGA
jgi:hypothetical protein